MNVDDNADEFSDTRGSEFGDSPRRPPGGATSGAETMERLLTAMLEENKRRDEMLERVLSSSRASTGTYQIMPDLTKTISTFSGNENASEWLDKIISMMTLHQWPDAFALETARSNLVGGALQWWHTYKQDINNFNDFTRAFRETFLQDEGLPVKWKKMSERIQRKDEALSEYYHAKVRLCKDLSLNFAETKEQILIGLYDRNICSAMLSKVHDNFNSLLHDLQNYERVEKARIERIKDKSEGKRQVTKVIENNRYERQEKSDTYMPRRNEEDKPLCFNCKKYGHVAKYCKFPRASITCFACKKEGHLQRNCPGASNREALSINYATDELKENDIKYFIDAKLDGKAIRSYIDQGSKCVTLRRQDARTLDVRYDKLKNPVTIKGYGMGQVIPVGQLTAELEVDAAKAQVTVFVVPDEAQEIPLLVGQPFTEQPHVTLVKRGKTLRLFEEKMHSEEEDNLGDMVIPELPTRKVTMWAKDTVVIPPNYVGYITLSTDLRKQKDIVIEPRFRPDNFCLPRCVTRPDKEAEVTVPLYNASSRDIIFEKGNAVLRGEVCEEQDEDDFDEVVQVEDSNVRKIRSREILEASSIGNEVQGEEREMLTSLIEEYSDCFALTIKEIGCTTKAKLEIELDKNEVVTYRPYRLSYSERQVVQKKINELKEAGIVEDSFSPFASPILLVRKKNGEERLCVDYRALNKNMKKDKFPLPLIDDQLERLQGKKYFSLLDLKSGYYQVPLSEEAKPKTAFVTPDGHYQFTRMPFGVANGPAVFQRLVNSILGPLKYTIVLAYLDDLLVLSTTIGEGIENLRMVFEILRQANLTLNPKKCYFFMEEIEYLGYEVSGTGIKPNRCKIDCIHEFPRPENVHQVRQFIGLTSYFRRFIGQYAIKAQPLTSLLKQETTWEWTSREQQAFDELKHCLTRKPVLAIFRNDLPTEVHTDASQIGLGGVLLQTQEDGKLHPIAYASRQTTREEAKYHSTELETLAIIWTVERFRHYLIGIHFRIVTDCNSVRSTFAKKDLIPRIGRWWIRIQDYTFDIEHRPGTSMQHVDALSRNPFEAPTETDCVQSIEVWNIDIEEEDWLFLAQKRDRKIRCIFEILKRKPSDCDKGEKMIRNEYELNGERIYRKQGEKLFLAVPKAMQWRVVKMFHDDKAHLALDKTLASLKEKYWFPRMRRYVKGYIGSCPECLFHKVPGGKRPGQLHSIDKVGIPFHTIHIDHLGPFIKSGRGNCYLTVAIDGFTKYVLLRAVKTTKSEPVVRFLRDTISLVGPPVRIISDQGTAFTGKTFKRFCQEHNIIHVKNATSTPRANGQVERVNRVLTAALASLVEDIDGRDWDCNVGRIQYSLNNTYHEATKSTPFSLLFNYEPRTFSGNRLYDEVLDQTEQLPDADGRRREALEEVRLDQRKQQDRYNKKRAKTKDYMEGDFVMVRREAPATGQSRKLCPKYKGPYVIIEKLPYDRYRISDIPGMQRSQKFYKGIASIDSLKKYYAHNEEEDLTSEEDEEWEGVESECGSEIVQKAEHSVTEDMQDVAETVNDEYGSDSSKRPTRALKMPEKFKDFELS